MQRDPEDVKEFLAESSAYLDAIEPELAALRADAGAADRDISAQVAKLFRAFHSIKGVAGFLSFSNIQDLTHKAESALDRVRSGKLAFDVALGGALLEACDLLRKYLSGIASRGDDAGHETEKSALAERLKEFTEPKAAAAIQAAATSTPGGWLFPWLKDTGLEVRFAEGAAAEVERAEQMLVALLDAPAKIHYLAEAGAVFESLRLHAQAFGWDTAAGLASSLAVSLSRPRPAGSVFDPTELSVYFGACNPLRSLLAGGSPAAEAALQSALVRTEVEKLSATPAVGAPAAAAKPSVPAAGAPAPGEGAAGAKNEIRVSLERLDKMVALIEELGVVSTGVVAAADLSEDGSGLRKSAMKLGKITEELQEITVSIRMVPLSGLFRKMIRLVGDVSSKLGKKARLEIVGEQTELDKDAVEALQDPLVHIVRNCLDHGLETPEQRAAAGKPEAGVVRLQAWHSAGEAWISISDDGKGIDRDKVLAKAVAQGLVSAQTDLGEKEILALVFEPGFSTAKEVTEFSGRGVGMDVVKRNVEGLKGRVEVESKPGKGSTFLIRLPMANALTESMLVRVGLIKYVIRVGAIRETFRPSLSAVTRLPDGSELVKLRGRLYPFLRLHNLHAVAEGETCLENGLIIIVENRGREIGIFVDEVIGKIQAVIKPPPPLVKQSTTVAGCSIIGTESDAVALALDINALDAKLAVARAP